MEKEIRTSEIKLLNSDRAVLFEGEINTLPLREKLILEKSKEYFDDPLPCYIHRGATVKRLYLEVINFFEQNKAEKTIWLWEELPQNIKYTLKQNQQILIVEYII